MDNWHLQPAHDHGLNLTDRARSVRREPGLMDAAAHAVWWSAGWAYLKLIHGLAVIGQENLPPLGPYVMVANHASHLDTLALTAAIPWRQRQSVFAVAAGDTFFASPLTGIVSAFVINALPVWRRRGGGHALAELRDRLGYEKCRYIVFPEGTRTRTGRMGSFKPGIGMLVAGTAVPVVPCRLSGTYEAMPAKRRLPRPGRVTVSIGLPLRFDEVDNNRDGWQAVADRTESAVVSLGAERLPIKSR